MTRKTSLHSLDDQDRFNLLVKQIRQGIKSSHSQMVEQQENEIQYSEEILSQFDQFKQKFNRCYADEKEEKKRLEIFAKVYEMIQKHNADPNQSYQMGINQFADKTPEELQKNRGFGCQRK